MSLSGNDRARIFKEHRSKSGFRTIDRFTATRMLIAGIVAFIFLLPMSVSYGRGFPEVSDNPYSDYYLQPIASSVLQIENMSRNARPLFFNETTGDVYLSDAVDGHHTLLRYNHATGTYTTLHTFPMDPSLWPLGDCIRSGVVCADGSIVISQRATKHVWRSVDGGVTFVDVHDVHAGADIWHMAVRGRYVYAAEYGQSTEHLYNVIWMSTDCGKNETWSEVARGYRDHTETNSHWHDIWTDPYTNYVYAYSGDAENLLVRSTDGVNFYQWGVFCRPTSMTADADNLYFGDDPLPRIVVYNKTTGEWRIEYVALDGTQTVPFYDLQAGANGVLYGRTTNEGYDPRYFGIYISPNGRDWAMVVNMSHSTGTYGEGAYYVIGPVKGYIWYGDTRDGQPQVDFNRSWAYRMKDITRAEAYAIVKQKEPRTLSSTVTYSEARRGWDGGTDYASFAQDVITDAELTIVGVGVNNLVDNPAMDIVKDMNQSWGEDGWCHDYYWLPEEHDNLSFKWTAERYHSAPYSVKVGGLNSTAYHGNIRLIQDLEPDDIAPGTPLVASCYFSIVNQNPNRFDDFQNGYTYFGIKLTVVYQDFTSDDAGGILGYGGNYIYLNGNMSSTQWSRAWTAPFTTDSEKIVHKILFDIYVTGIASMWIDDLQLQCGSHLTPFINEHGVMTKSEDVNVTVAGTKYNIGTLADGASKTVSLGTLSGLVPLSFQINGSRAVNWTISGNRTAATWNTLVALDGDLLKATHIYANLTVEVWTQARIDVASFLEISGTKPMMTVMSVNGRVNLSFASWFITDSCRWTAIGSASNTIATFTLSGLDSSVGYKVYVDGVQIYQQLKGPTGLTFTYSGPWSEHTFEVVVWDYTPGVGVQASFSYTIDGTVVTFTDKSYGPVVMWIWNFGDNTGSPKQSPMHKYAASGKYTVILTVYDAEGRSSTAKTVVELKLGPDFPVERTPKGWNIWVSDQATLSAPALAFLIFGIWILASAYFPPILPFVNPKLKKILGIILLIVAIYWYGFIDDNWFGG